MEIRNFPHLVCRAQSVTVYLHQVLRQIQQKTLHTQPKVRFFIPKVNKSVKPDSATILRTEAKIRCLIPNVNKLVEASF